MEESEVGSVNVLHDSRVDCTSLLINMSIENYLSLISKAYHSKGGIPYQRDALRTTSAKRIRTRMVEDIVKGTILPPIVIGVVIDDDSFKKISEENNASLIESIQGKWSETVSIIDGMQRTTALIDAAEVHENVLRNSVRIEFWITNNTNSLIYRMLVLNTGQVPWNIKRQLQVVYSPLIAELQEKIKFKRLFTLDQSGRRIHGGEYKAEDIIETYLAFGLRKTEIDTQETLADEYSRLDIADAISNDKFRNFYYPILQLMVNLDTVLSRRDNQPEGIEETSGKYTIGRNIFDSQPARIGFIVACSISVLGRLGMDKDESESKNIIDKIIHNCNNLIDELDKKSPEELYLFLGLDVLSERLSGQKRSAIGRHERAFFESAFKILIDENFNVPTLEVCWRG